ncbi:hypothetical protein B484DRAFT_168846 [Ochromonadaceae sp. CCMP2298]|nr:hypothetical protein B484DRAFT_168846 [Ochromonadaceae sp. CCMP2298]
MYVLNPHYMYETPTPYTHVNRRRRHTPHIQRSPSALLPVRDAHASHHRLRGGPSHRAGPGQTHLRPGEGVQEPHKPALQPLPIRVSGAARALLLRAQRQPEPHPRGRLGGSCPLRVAAVPLLPGRAAARRGGVRALRVPNTGPAHVQQAPQCGLFGGIQGLVPAPAEPRSVGETGQRACADGPVHGLHQQRHGGYSGQQPHQWRAGCVPETARLQGALTPPPHH